MKELTAAEAGFAFGHHHYWPCVTPHMYRMMKSGKYTKMSPGKTARKRAKGEAGPAAHRARKAAKAERSRQERLNKRGKKG
jgi:hypothetical protein